MFIYYWRRGRFLFRKFFRESSIVTLSVSTANTGLLCILKSRYKAILCDKDEYLPTLVRYLHYNPVRAKVTRVPEEYPWSSERQYGKYNKDAIVDTTLVLRLFAEDLAEAKRRYRKHIEEGAAVFNANMYKTVDQRILGGEEFVDRVMRRGQKSVVPGRRRLKTENTETY